MRSIVLAGTQLSVSRISLGTGSLHHIRSSRGRQALLEAALAEGITHFDTSPYYGFGLAEIELGRFLRSHRTKVTIASKFGLYPPPGAGTGSIRVAARKLLGKAIPSLARPVSDWSLQRASASLETTLKSLGVESLDLLLLHDPAPHMLEPSAILEWLELSKSRGLIREWGVSGDAAQFECWLKVRSPLCRVTQARDSTEGREADVITSAGLPLQFTYGYLAGIRAGKATKESVREQLIGALQRNASGSVLVSTRKLDHLRQIAKVAGSDDHAPA